MKWILLHISFFSFFFSTLSIYTETNIYFDPSEWEVTDVSIGEYHTKEIKIKCTGDINITSIRPACECLKVEVVNKTVGSKQDGVISATLHVDNSLSAFFRVFCYVHTSDPKNPFYKYYITGRVKGKGLSNSEIVIFRTPMIKDYQEIQKSFEELRAKNPFLTIKEYFSADIETTRLRSQFEKQYSLNKYADVEMFTGNGSFIGKDAIIKEITRMSNLKPPMPDKGINTDITNKSESHEKDSIEILYFYSVGCGGCKEIEGYLFPKILKTYGDKIIIRNLDIANIKNYEHLIELENKYQIKSNAPVSIFVGNKYLLGSKEILGKTEAMIKEAMQIADCGFRIEEANHGRKDFVIQDRFKSFSSLAVIGAGLLDGINPCAFATIIFLISFLTFVGKTRKEIILVGVFYTLAVFLTYLLLGIGIFKTVQTLSTYHLISRVILYAMAAMVFSLAGLTLYDLFVYLRTKKTAGIALQLPFSLKQRIHTTIRENIKPGGLIIGALVIGFFVTLFEAVCTGQVYLPTIVFMLKDADLKNNAFEYLVLYNLMFIIPLIVVFTLAYLGVSSQWFTSIAQRNLVLSKVMTSVFFIGLGIVILFI